MAIQTEASDLDTAIDAVVTALSDFFDEVDGDVGGTISNQDAARYKAYAAQALENAYVRAKGGNAVASVESRVIQDAA